MKLTQSQTRMLAFIFTAEVERVSGPLTVSDREGFFHSHLAILNSFSKYLPSNITEEELMSKPELMIPVGRAHLFNMIRSREDSYGIEDDEILNAIDDFAAADVASHFLPIATTVFRTLPLLELAEAATDWTDESIDAELEVLLTPGL